MNKLLSFRRRRRRRRRRIERNIKIQDEESEGRKSAHGKCYKMMKTTDLLGRRTGLLWTVRCLLGHDG